MSIDFAGKDLPLELKKFDSIERSERREAKSLAAAKRRVVRTYVLAQRAAQFERRAKHALARAKGGQGQAAFWYGQHNRMTVLIEVGNGVLGRQVFEQLVIGSRWKTVGVSEKNALRHGF